MFILRAQPHAQSLFLFPIVFGIDFIHFFDEKDGAAGNSIVCFGASIPCHAIWQKRRRMRTVSKSATYLRATEVWTQRQRIYVQRKCELSAIQEGSPRKRCKFLARKVQNSSPILRCTFWQGKVQNSSPISALLKVTSLPSHSLSLSLSLCISLSLYHRAHLTQNIGSASALPIMPEVCPLKQKKSKNKIE